MVFSPLPYPTLPGVKMHSSPLSDALILLSLSVAAVAALRRLHLPPILGYLLVGVVAGQHALGWIPESEIVHLLAEVGVVFLLFMIGLEISIPQLMSMRHAVLGFGGLQMLLSTASGALLAWWIGIPLEGAIIVGGALALSSTAIVARQLTEQLEMQSRHGRLAFGILLFQDLAVVPFLVMIPILGGEADNGMAMALSIAILKGVFVIIAMLLTGRYLLRPVLHWIAAAQSVELFTLTILLMALTAAWLTDLFGLSLALGSFIAGMLIGDTEYRHQVETEMRPFRDVLMGLFFITVGTQLDLFILPQHIPWIALLVAGVVLGKGALIFVLVRSGGTDTGVALRTGISLAQAGEFGFALLALALGHGLLTAEQSQPILAAVVISMSLAPLLVRKNGQIAKRLSGGYRRFEEDRAHHIEEKTQQLAGHVVLCGFGRVGQNLALFLREENIEYVALDLDTALISEAWEAGEPVFYADATHPEILEAAGLYRARAVVIAMHDHHLAERIIQTATLLKPGIPIVVRASEEAFIERFEAAGASDVVPESVEASLILATRLLHRLDIDLDEIQRLVEQARTDHYRRLRSYFHGEELESTEAVDRFRLHTVVLNPEAATIGHRILELNLDDLGVKVVTVRRAGICGEEPDPEMVLRNGDALILQGPADQLDIAEAWLLKG